MGKLVIDPTNGTDFSIKQYFAEIQLDLKHRWKGETIRIPTIPIWLATIPGFEPKTKPNRQVFIQKWFLFAMVWSRKPKWPPVTKNAFHFGAFTRIIKNVLTSRLRTKTFSFLSTKSLDTKFMFSRSYQVVSNAFYFFHLIHQSESRNTVVCSEIWFLTKAIILYDWSNIPFRNCNAMWQRYSLEKLISEFELRIHPSKYKSPLGLFFPWTVPQFEARTAKFSGRRYW